MKSKSVGNFSKNPPDGAGHGLKCIESKKRQHFYFKNFLRPSTLLLYIKKLFVSEKTQKSELCHFSMEIYVIKFCRGRTRTYAPREKFVT